MEIIFSVNEAYRTNLANLAVENIFYRQRLINGMYCVTADFSKNAFNAVAFDAIAKGLETDRIPYKAEFGINRKPSRKCIREGICKNGKYISNSIIKYEDWSQLELIWLLLN